MSDMTVGTLRAIFAEQGAAQLIAKITQLQSLMERTAAKATEMGAAAEKASTASAAASTKAATAAAAAGSKVEGSSERQTKAAQDTEKAATAAGNASAAAGEKAVEAGASEAAAAEKATKSTSTLTATVTKHKDALNTIAGVALKTGAIGVAAVGVAVASTITFGKAMSDVQANTHASSEELKKLSDTAVDYSTKSVFSATQVAEAENELAKAGLTTSQIMGGGLEGALNLAHAGNLDVATSAEIAASAMNQFGLGASDTSHIADLLAAGADKAQGSVQDLGEALTYVGPTAHGMGISIEETTGALTLFASRGITGSQAGTQLRGILSSLTGPSKVAADEMKSLGINLYDAQGHFIGIDGAAQQLHDHMSGLSESQRNAALATIFGNQQLSGAQILYQGGAADVDKYTKAVNDNGFAAQQSHTKLNNLWGDLKKLSSTVNADFIKSGSGVNGFFRDVVQGATGLVDKLGDVDESTLKAGASIIGIGSAAALAFGGLMKGTVAVAEFAEKVKTLREADGIVGSISRIGTTAGGVVGSITLAVGAMALAEYGAIRLNNAIENGGVSIATLSKRMQEGTNATKNFTTAFTTGLGNNASVFKNAGSNVGTLIDQLSQAKKIRDATNEFAAASGGASELDDSMTKANVAVDKWGKAMSKTFGSDTAAAQSQMRQLVTQQGLSNGQVDELINSSGKYKSTLEEAAKSAGLSTSAENLRKIALGQSKEYLEAASRAQNGYNKTQLDGATQELQWQQSLNDLDDAVGNNAHTLDEHTTAGNQNRQMLAQAADQTLKYAQSQSEAGRSAADVKATLDSGRQSIIQHAEALGASADEANALADQYMSLDSMNDILKNVKVEGIAKANDDLNSLGMSVKTLPNGKIEIKGDNKQAMASIAAVAGAKIDPKTGTITASDDQWQVIYALVQGAKIDPKTGVMYGENTDMWNKWAAANGLTIDPKTGAILGDNGPIKGTVGETNGLTIDPKTGYFYANPDSYHATKSAVEGEKIKDKDVAINAHKGAGWDIDAWVHDITVKVKGMFSAAFGSANGNYFPAVNAFAQGGESHIAQIARPMAPYRIWAEPETGGEAYIPLAASKRARSTAILSRVADEFNMALIPLHRFADGGVEQTRTVTTAVAAPVGQLGNAGQFFNVQGALVEVRTTGGNAAVIGQSIASNMNMRIRRRTQRGVSL